MLDTTAINLVSQKLSNEKELIEYRLNKLTLAKYDSVNKVDEIRKTLSDYSRITSEIQLWNTIITSTDESRTDNKRPDNGQ